MLDLTTTQKRVYLLLKRRWQQRGSQPNLHDLARELDIHYVSLKQHLNALSKKHYLDIKSQGRGKSPIIQLSEVEAAPGVPLLGEIAAGGLHEAVEHLEGFLKVPGRSDRFALRVKGDSMSEPIQDGDIVILRQAKPVSGQICAVRHEDETTLKYLELHQDGFALLRPHNPDYDPIEVATEDIYVAGVFDALLRGSIVDSLFSEAA